jgi:hypothetical protein
VGTDPTESARRHRALLHLALMVADEPEVAAACTTALLRSNDPTVHTVFDGPPPVPPPAGRSGFFRPK